MLQSDSRKKEEKIDDALMDFELMLEGFVYACVDTSPNEHKRSRILSSFYDLTDLIRSFHEEMDK